MIKKILKKIYKGLFWKDMEYEFGEIFATGLALLIAVAAYTGMYIGYEAGFQTWAWASIMAIMIFIMFSNLIKKDITPALKIAYFLMIAGAFVFIDLIMISTALIIIQAITYIIKIVMEMKKK